MKTVGKQKLPLFEVRILVTCEDDDGFEMERWSENIPYTLRDGEYFCGFGIYRNVVVQETKGTAVPDVIEQRWVADFQDQADANEYAAWKNQ